MFWPVVYTSMAVSAATFVVVYGYWRWWPNRRHKRRVKDMAAMRDLLVHHVDDLDDIMDKLKHGTREYARLWIAVLSCVTLLHLTRQCGTTSWDFYLTSSAHLHCDALCVSATSCSMLAAMAALNVWLV